MKKLLTMCVGILLTGLITPPPCIFAKCWV